MKKKILLILLLGIIIFPLKAQLLYPKGVYLSFNELMEKAPSSDLDLIVERRTSSDIAMVGGNDYKLISKTKSVKKSYLRNEVFAYSDGEELYLNGIPMRLFSGYIKVINDGDKYFIFRASVSQDGYTNMFGGTGGAIQAAERYLYAYDKLARKLIPISVETLKNLLKDNQNLLDKYLNEADQKSEKILLKYLIMLNGYDADN